MTWRSRVLVVGWQHAGFPRRDILKAAKREVKGSCGVGQGASGDTVLLCRLSPRQRPLPMSECRWGAGRAHTFLPSGDVSRAGTEVSFPTSTEQRCSAHVRREPRRAPSRARSCRRVDREEGWGYHRGRCTRAGRHVRVVRSFKQRQSPRQEHRLANGDSMLFVLIFVDSLP